MASPPHVTLSPQRSLVLVRRIFGLAGAALLALYFLFAFTVLVLRYAVLPHIDHFRPDLESLAAHALKQRVSIAAVKADWVGLRPRLTLSDVVVYDAANRAALKLPEVGATFAWESFTVLDLRLHRLRISAPDLDIRRSADGVVTVGGIVLDPHNASSRGGVLPWLLSQDEISVTEAHLHWTDQLRGAPRLDVDDLNIELQQSGIQHRFAVSGRPPALLAAPVDLRGVLTRNLFALTSDARQWSGDVYAGCGFVDLAAWRPYLDYPFEVSHGTGALRSWIHFSEEGRHGGRQGRLFDVVADLHLADVAARSRPELPPLSLTNVAGRVTITEASGSDRLTLRRFNLASADGLSLESMDLDARRTLDGQGHSTETSLATSRLDLHTLAELVARLPVASDVQTMVAKFKPRGVLKDFQFSWQGALGQPKAYHFASSFDGLGIAAPSAVGPLPEVPGFQNISGDVSADQTGGSISLHASNGTLSLPGVFAEPDIALDHLNASAKWTQQRDRLAINVSSLAFDNADAAGSASGSYVRGASSGSNGPGFLDLSARLTRASVRRVARYLPAGIPEDVRSYVERALLAGTADDVSFRVHGALERFPFRQGAAGAAVARTSIVTEANPRAPPLLAAAAHPEEFHIAARLHGVKVDYAPRAPTDENPDPLWPPIEDLEADLTLDRSRLEIQGHSARLYGFKLEKLRVELPDLDDHNEILQVHGGGNGALADLLRFVNASPVSGWLDHALSATRGTGPAHLDLTLGLPLSHMAQAKASGTIQFQNNDITLFPWLPALAHTSGRLDFSDDGVSLKDANTQFLGGNTRIEASTGDDHFIQVRADGNIVATALRRMENQPFLNRMAERLDGTAPYKVTLNLAPHSADDRSVAAHGPKIVIESGLVGLGIDLPAPAHKLPPEVLPLRIEIDPSRTQRDEVSDQIRARLGSTLSAVFARQQSRTGDMEVVHAGYGIGEAAALSDARAQASVNLPMLDMDAWQAALNTLAGVNVGAALNAPAGSEGLLAPDSISARVQSLRVGDKTFGNVVLNATHSATTWQANVSSDEVAGSIAWRQGSLSGSQQNRITARLTRLVVPRSATQDVSNLLEAGPTTLPALDITADNFELRDKKLGKLELVASNSSPGGRREWRLEKLNLINPDATLAATGTWGSTGDAADPLERTAMDFTLEASDVGGLMDRLGLKGTIKGGTATLKGDVNWHGSPLALDYESLSGNLNLKASRGQFLKAEPGVAKLLGVLSLQSLTRRLSLDFTDLFAGGFAFDAIDADATVQDGVASTRNFSMRGVSANVAIDGSADLAHETQNLHVRVLPQINLGTGSIAYALLINPVIGLGTLAIGEVLRDPLSKALAFEYNVSGPWTDPSIVRLDRNGAAPSAPAVPLVPAVPLGPSPTPTPELVPLSPTSPLGPGPAPANPPGAVTGPGPTPAPTL